MLSVTGLTTRYGAISALRDADLHVGSGEVVGLIGPNGAGKTTLLNTVAGLLTPSEGTVSFEGEDVTGTSPERLLRSGLALVPEHRRIFVDLTVEENLRIGGVTVAQRERGDLLDEMAERFPVLGEKWSTAAGYLSGGEAQQLAIARTLMSKPRLVMMDEPSLGLAPVLAAPCLSWSRTRRGCWRSRTVRMSCGAARWWPQAPARSCEARTTCSRPL